MRVFLAVAAVFAWIVGSMLIFFPGEFYAPTGIQMTPMIATLAQAHGATLLGMGLIDWLARNAEKSGVVAVLGGNLLTQVLSLGVILRTMTLGAGVAVAPGIVIHVVLAGTFCYFLLARNRDYSAEPVSAHTLSFDKCASDG